MTTYTVTAKGRRWARRWNTAKRAAVWAFMLGWCLFALTVFTWAILAYVTSPIINVP